MFGRKNSVKELLDRSAPKLVRELYLGLLEREADATGLQHYSTDIRRKDGLVDTLRSLVRSDEFIELHRRRHPIKDLAANPAELMRALYLGLLKREIDPDGLRTYVERLRSDGDIEGVVSSLVSSDEFLLIFREHNPARVSAIEESLREPRKNIHIYSNCQGHNLARCIQALTGARSPSFSFFNGDDMGDPRRGVAAMQAALEKYDVVLTQPLIANVIAEQWPELLTHPKLMLFPSVAFPAFQPDQCYVCKKGGFEEVPGPLGPYHSSIAYYAWRTGKTVDQAVEFFREDVYDKLRFFDYWDAAAEALVEEGQRTGMPMDARLKSWRARGCFMHSPNHPRLFVIADIARLVLERLEIETLPIDPVQLVWDNLAETSVWPVYPEIGRRFGIEGSYVFKGNNFGLPGKAPILLYELREFVERSFAAYDEADRRYGIWCNRPYSARYRDVFENSAAIASPAIAARPLTVQPRSSASPYAGLPDHQFWRKAVQEVAPGDVDPVSSGQELRIETATRVATAGSCFAQHISRSLSRRGFNYLVTESAADGVETAEAVRRNYGVYSARYGNVYTARQLVQLMDRAFGRFVPSMPAWQRPDGRWADPFRPEIEPQGFSNPQSMAHARAEHLNAVRQMFETVEVFVFTLGLTEAWRATADGAVFPLAPGVVAGAEHLAACEFVNFSVTEVIADLADFVEKLAAVNASAKVIFTVSPVPLAATYESQHVLNASSYSKSVLRVAAEEIVRRHVQCIYFPSYEIVTGTFSRGAYFDADLRSVNAAGVDHVMRLFFKHHASGPGARPVDAELREEAENNYRVICEEERIADVAR